MQLNSFLARLTGRIAPQRDGRNLMISELRSPEVVDSLEAEFRQQLERFFDYRAIDMMDHLSVNEYWFLLMTGAALVRCRSLPASTLDVQEGIFVLRCRILRNVQGEAVFELLRKKQADKLNAAQVEFAKAEGLLVWGRTFAGQMQVKTNPVYFGNTGEW